MRSKTILLLAWLAASPVFAYELKNLKNFTRVSPQEQTFVNDPGEEKHSSLLQISAIAGAFDPHLANDPKTQALYEEGLREILTAKGLKNISFTGVRAVTLKKHPGVLFSLSFTETSDHPVPILNQILILANGDRESLDIDFSAPATRSHREWKQVLQSIEASLP